MSLFTLADLSRADPIEGYPGQVFDVATINRRQARVKIPASENASREAVLAALYRQVARLGRPVVEGRMLSVAGFELHVGDHEPTSEG